MVWGKGWAGVVERREIVRVYVLKTASKPHCMLMNDPLLRSVEYENEIYAAAVQMRLAVIPKNAPAATGNHSCAVFVTFRYPSAPHLQLSSIVLWLGGRTIP